MSVYGRAKTFSIVIWIAFLLSPLWLLLLHAMSPVALALGLVACLSLGVVTAARFRCRNCRNPAFRYRALKWVDKDGLLSWRPFPKEVCGVCGSDLASQ